jgi:hypothetical protein
MSKVENSEANTKKCACPRCPTYDECAKEKREVLYCAKGKSACTLPNKGCICAACPLWEQYELEKGFFCFYGEAI